MAQDGFRGMADLIRGLERMGDAVQREAAVIVEDTAERMAFSVRQRYPRGKTGTLRDRVVVEQLHPSSGASLRWKVRSKAPHAHLYERGTVNRRTASTGANRGRMAAHPIFIPEAIRHRTVMVHRLVDLLARQTVPQMTGHMEVRRT